MEQLNSNPLLKKVTVSQLSDNVSQEILEDVMHTDFVGVVKSFVPASKNKNSRTGRVVYKFDYCNYFTMVSTYKGEQNTVVNIIGDSRRVKEVFINSGFTVEQNDQASLEYIKNFINEVSDILPNAIKEYDYKNGDFEDTQQAGKFDFEVKVKTVFFIKSRTSISERMNCSLSITSKATGLVERVKFRIQDSKFIYGTSVFDFENVRPNFFKHKLKKVFLTYSKNIVDEYGLIDKKKRPKDITDEEYERMKIIVKWLPFRRYPIMKVSKSKKNKLKQTLKKYLRKIKQMKIGW